MMAINGTDSSDGAASSIRVVLVDDVLLTQECLALVLQNGAHDLAVSVVSHTNEMQEQPDVVLVNGKFHNLDDQAIQNEISYIIETWPSVPRLIILERSDMPANTALQALRLGWHGYFPAHERLDLLIMAIRIIRMGGIFVPSELGQYLRLESAPS
jgi:DNA-binding NarL/FixJ family response regulator